MPGSGFEGAASGRPALADRPASQERAARHLAHVGCRQGHPCPGLGAAGSSLGSRGGAFWDEWGGWSRRQVPASGPHLGDGPVASRVSSPALTWDVVAEVSMSSWPQPSPVDGGKGGKLDAGQPRLV